MKALLLITALAVLQTQGSSEVDGKWIWQGSAGWQRVALEVKAEGETLTGVIRMGRGGEVPKERTDFWEYFVDPVEFKISKGKISGNTVFFEHDVQRTSALNPIDNPLVVKPRPEPHAKLIYRGTIQGDQILFTREISPAGGVTWPMGTHKVRFTMTRVR